MYQGVINKNRSLANPCKAEIGWQGKRYYLGSFRTAHQAAMAYDWAARLIGDERRLNSALSEELGAPPCSKGAADLIAHVSRQGGAEALGCGADGRFHGVYAKRSGDDAASPAVQFQAQIRWQQKIYYLGTFHTALQAAMAYDWAARLIGDGRPLNLSLEADLGGEPTRIPGVVQLSQDVAAASQRTSARVAAGSTVSRAMRHPRPVAGPAAENSAHIALSSKRPAPLALHPAAPPPQKQRSSSSTVKQQPTTTAAARKQPIGRMDAARIANAPSRPKRSTLLSQLRALLRQRELRDDDLALDELSDGALHDIAADVRRTGEGPSQSDEFEPSVSLLGYSALDLKARAAVNMRLRSFSEEGIRLDLLSKDEVGRGLLVSMLSGMLKTGE